jgi:hypothetical protein
MPVHDPISTHDDPGQGRAIVLRNNVAVMHGPDVAKVIGRDGARPDRCMIDVRDGMLIIRAATKDERKSSIYNPPVVWKRDRSIARIPLGDAVKQLIGDAERAQDEPVEARVGDDRGETVIVIRRQ